MGGDHHPMHANGLGRADERAQVLWILQGVQDEHKQGFAPLPGIIEDIVQAHVGITADFQRHPLMTITEFIQPEARHVFDGYFALLCQVQDLG
jgi:hypothetical protein